MRAIWINEGDELDAPRCRAFGITRVYFSERAHSSTHIAQGRREGFEVGIYSNPQWYGFPDPKPMRDLLSRAVTRMDGDNKQLSVQLNYEPHNAAWAIEFFYWWRRARAARDTSWTMEGFQGGWCAEALLHPNLENTIAVPQCYSGSMQPWLTAAVVRDLVDWGVPLARIHPFVDAQFADWRASNVDVFYYMQHRLP